MPTTKTRRSRSKKSNGSRDIYQEVTNTIVAALESGTAPWHKPWRPVAGSDARHRNFVSKKPYRGVNTFLLDIVALTHGYSHPYWMTFNQCKDKGGKVRKGEKATQVVFWKILKNEEIDPESGEKKTKTVPLLRFYYVFNIDQCEGIEPPQVEKPKEEDPFTPIEHAQAVIDRMPKAPPIRHHGNRACYYPLTDKIDLPAPKAFDSPEDYYRTAYHELGHSTAAKKRLDRGLDTNFGSEPYAKEELVAELCSAMVAGVVGIEGVDNSASYLKGWINRLHEDKKLIIHAASKAQKAADFILGETMNGENK